MARSKNSPALFELLRGQRRGTADPLQVPGWLSTGGTGAATAVTEQDRMDEPRPRIVREEADEAQHQKPSPFFELDGPILRISLTSKTGGLVLFGAMVILLSAYVLGRHGGKDQAPNTDQVATVESPVGNELEELRSKPPAPQIVADLLVNPTALTAAGKAADSPSARRPATLVNGTWAKGLTYIVAQEFNQGQTDEARRAQEYLDQHGIPAAVVPLKSGDIFLITTQGYNRQEAPQKKASDDLLERVRAVGEKYFKAGGRYRLEGYLKKLNGDSWQ